MNKNEKDLYEYIDKLNAEEKPDAHENRNKNNSAELEKLFDAVRSVRSLKEPVFPDADFPKHLASTVAVRLTQKAPAIKAPIKKTPAKKAPVRKRNRMWFIGAAAAVVIFAAVLVNFFLPFGRNDIVYAMEKAFDEVKTYHGILEFAVSSEDGKETAQVKLEVWADKEGHYYVRQLEGSQAGLITANNGERKWQVRPDLKQVNIFPAFPDPFHFAFELGREVDEVKNALETRMIGEETVAGRKTSIIEVSPQGGIPYRIWVDRQTGLPLQRQSGMYNALQYRATYTEIDFDKAVPDEYRNYKLPDGFRENGANAEQLVNNMEEAREIVGFIPGIPETAPAGYVINGITVTADTKAVKAYYFRQDEQIKVVFLQRKASGEFKPAPNAVLGKVNSSSAEILTPAGESTGMLTDDGPYSSRTDINSIRWQKAGFEYTVLGNVSVNELASFIKNLTGEGIEIPLTDVQSQYQPEVAVPVDMKVEENEQKSVDAGHSPWRLDPVFVAQVFVSLKISPEGITGDYPVKTGELKIVQNTGKNAVIEVNSANSVNSPVKRVFLKRLLREDETGIWTVTGYDPAD